MTSNQTRPTDEDPADPSAHEQYDYLLAEITNALGDDFRLARELDEVVGERLREARQDCSAVALQLAGLERKVEWATQEVERIRAEIRAEGASAR